mmetsp:Transcript_6806/g.7278  ORF Transcript_6806/g.7278 Transcript_6806/m.7278 type:complete len:410 (+) Transcript_6806:177-1406(+)
MTSLLQSESSLGISYSHWDWEDDEWDWIEKPEALQKDTPKPVATTSSLGLICVTSSAFLFGIVAALVKLIALNVYMMILVRGSLQWVFSIVAVCAFMPASTSTLSNFIGEPRHRPILFLRSGLYWGFICLFWTALDLLPLGDATTVVYCSPLFTALFSWLLLGEPIPPSVIVCMALSMVGVILVTQPTFLFGNGMEEQTEDMVQYDRGMLYAFLSAALGGLLPVLVRKSKECHWATVEHATALCSTAIFTPAAMGVLALTKDADSDESSNTDLWEGIQDPRALLLLGLVALVGFAGLGLQTYGFQREAAARASVMTFLEIPFSYVLQFLMFGDLLTPIQGCGMLLVISSGLFNFIPRLKSSQQTTAVQTSNSTDLGTELADCATGPKTQHNEGLHSFRLMNEQSPQTTK